MAIEIYGLPIKHGDFPWQTVSHNQMVWQIARLILKIIYPIFPCPWNITMVDDKKHIKTHGVIIRHTMPVRGELPHTPAAPWIGARARGTRGAIGEFQGIAQATGRRNG